MFENFCALLLRLYPAEFRRAYGGEAMQLMRDRARHERVFLRVRLLMDLAIDLGATSLHGWQPGAVARADRWRTSVRHHRHPGSAPEALVAGMLTSIVMFATFTLLLQPRALPNAPTHLSKRSGSEMPGADSNHSAQQAIATDPETHHKLIAAIAANLKQRYVDRAIGQQLADALLARDKNGGANRSTWGRVSRLASIGTFRPPVARSEFLAAYSWLTWCIARDRCRRARRHR
jgi:hypothetical protein